MIFPRSVMLTDGNLKFLSRWKTYRRDSREKCFNSKGKHWERMLRCCCWLMIAMMMMTIMILLIAVEWISGGSPMLCTVMMNKYKIGISSR